MHRWNALDKTFPIPIKGFHPRGGIPCLSVDRSLCPVTDLLNAFGIRFSVIDVRGPKSVEVCFLIEIGRSLQVYGQRSCKF
jgi:hypothetical protein